MTISNTHNKNTTSQTRVRRGAVLAMALSGLASGAMAGPVGAVGDLYAVATATSSTPMILQYDGETGDFVGTFATRGGGGLGSMAWGPNGNLFVIHGITTLWWRVAEFDGETGAFIQNVMETDPPQSPSDLTIGKGMAFGPDGDLYIGDFWLGTVTRYDGTTFTEIASTPEGSVGTPSGIHFAPNGNLFVLSGGLNTIREYNTDDGGIDYLGDFGNVPGASQPQDFTWGPNGNIFVTRGGSGGVAELDGTTGAFIGNFVPANSSLPTNGLAFDDFGRFLVSIVFPVSRIDAYDAATGASQGIFTTEGLADVGSIPTLLSIKPGPGGCSVVDFAEPFGQLNFSDVSAFLSLFSAGDGSADMNGDGALNFFDISDFLVAYSAGCP